MSIYRLSGRFLEESTYIVSKGEACLVIDPGADAEKILSFCEEKGICIQAVLLTHAHVDHTYGAAELSKLGYPIYLHDSEAELLNGRGNLALAFGVSLEKILKYRTFEGERRTIDLDPFIVEVIHTPGHTAGSVCYLIEGDLFSGDTLFADSYGRTDLPSGDEQDLICSIANELFELPLETFVYAGHSQHAEGEGEAQPDTTIGEERITNPILELI